MSTCHLTRMHIMAYAENRDQCLHTHTHVCLRSKEHVVTLRCLSDVRVCDFTHMCVADACRHVCFGTGCCCTWLRIVSSRANTHTHMRTRAHVCGVSGKPRSCALVTVRTHTHTHTRTHTHTCVLHKPGIRGHALSCLDCLPVAPPVCCRSRGLRPRCTASGAFL